MSKPLLRARFALNHGAMLLLAHISDLHFAGAPQLKELAGKRGLGFINWHRRRKHIHRAEILQEVTNDLKARAAEHVAVTGDLVNLSLPAEYARARAWLETLGSPDAVTAIPGNHDIYVPQVRDGPAKSWGDYMRDDDGAPGGAFPFLRRRGNVALIGLSSALPTAPFLATGRLGAEQLIRFADALERTRELFRVVLIHHPPASPAHRHLRRLTDADEFRQVLAAKGAELVLHGHDHRRSLMWLDGPRRKIPAIGAPSASARAPHGDEDAAGYHLYEIDGKPGAWRCQMVTRERGTDGIIREVERQTLG
jgi:3',5'-cyclic AMP phosphodiesterase CpdA